MGIIAASAFTMRFDVTRIPRLHNPSTNRAMKVRGPPTPKLSPGTNTTGDLPR